MQNSTCKIGVLSIQGSFFEHIEVLRSMGVNGFPVRCVEDLSLVDSLILPGGESTTISKLLKRFKIEEEIIKRVNEGMPIYGTCAGMILLSKNIDYSMKLMDIEVDRNAYGSQLDSFIGKLTDVNKEELGVDSLDAFFIRAPRIKQVGDAVLVLASHEGIPVMVRENNILVSSFHPELTEDGTVYEYFLSIGRGGRT